MSSAVRRCRRGMPIRCWTPYGPVHAVVYDRQLPRERERGLVYVRLTADCAMGRRGQRLHVPLARCQRRQRRAHAHGPRLAWALQLQHVLTGH